MKKIVFLFAMVLIAGVVMAQTNRSVISQADGTQTATVDQQGSLNTSNVTQSNEGNEATINQVNMNLLPGNLVLSNVTQSGKKNEIIVDQVHDGDYGNAEGIIETYALQSGNNNEAHQKQGGTHTTGTLFASLTQSGNNNFASQNQRKYWNNAYVIQSGDGNTAMQAQDAEFIEEVETSHYGYINQSGNNNYAEQDQNGHGNSAVAVQSGNGNDVWQYQNAFKSEARVDQLLGNNNDATQTQMGASNFATINQSSNGNEALQNQEGGDRRGGTNYDANNLAEIFQLGGNGNVAFQYQTTPGGGVDLNHAWARQEGVGNYSMQDQDGGFNVSTVSQVGNGHSANVTQSQSIFQVN
ncbi:hypothetical protein [Draconibacterium orientale]|uniref:hypothetical protein n=1 Tax=Draconibacterium orientale TaxID=1168034 RepID=UPI002ABE6A90|nr:hypothetical protein [Draconibacterium orientale]